LVEREGEGFRIRDDVDEVFERLGGLQRGGSLWVPTLRALGDHLAAIAELRVTYAADGSVVVTGGNLDAQDVTFAVPTVGATIAVDGSAPDGVARRDGQTIFWFDLPRGSSRTIRTSRDGIERRFSPVGSTPVEP
jgi:hypothetical protein